MRMILRVVAIAAMTGGAGFAQYAPPSPGPIGWETRIIPGFTPPIEYVLTYERFELGQGPKLDAVVRGWGPSAGAALVKLYRDPEWADHRQDLLNLIAKVDSPEITSFLKEEANKILTEVPPSKRPDYTAVSILNMLAKRDPDAADRIAYQVVQDPSALYFESMIGYLTIRAGQDNGVECRARLESMASATSDEKLRRRIRDTLSGQEAHERAGEPMENVLKQESRGEKP